MRWLSLVGFVVLLSLAINGWHGPYPKSRAWTLCAIGVVGMLGFLALNYARRPRDGA